MGKKPEKNQSKNTARWINALLIIGALAITGSIIWYAVKPPVEPTSLAGLPKPATTTLAPEQFTGTTRLAYEAAKEVPELLAQLPCYCGCMSGFGHRSNLDCFHDSHGVECTMCQDIALDARQMYKDGIAVDRIRDNIKQKYGRLAELEQ